ncbi:MAG: RCC1 domain-containing protein [Actinoplanes sp.]
MWITRRVLAILVVVAAVFFAAAPASADRSEICTENCRDRMVEMGLEGRVVQLVAGSDGTCALTERGQVFCWGASYPDPYAPARSPLVLVTIGALLVAGGTTLLLLSRR